MNHETEQELDDRERRQLDNPNHKYPRPACQCTLNTNATLDEMFAPYKEPDLYFWDFDLQHWICPDCGFVYQG